MEMWKPYAKENIVTLYTEQLHNGPELMFFKDYYSQRYIFFSFSTRCNKSHTTVVLNTFKYTAPAIFQNVPRGLEFLKPVIPNCIMCLFL